MVVAGNVSAANGGLLVGDHRPDGTHLDTILHTPAFAGDPKKGFRNPCMTGTPETFDVRYFFLLIFLLRIP